MPLLYVVLIVLVLAFVAYFSVHALRSGRNRPAPSPEALLLEEAIVTQPIAPGMEGVAELRKPGALPLVLRVRTTDSAQAFARGSTVRIIDFRDGCWFIESADEEHLVR